MSNQYWNKMKIIWLSVFMLMSTLSTAYAADYHWQSISFKHGEKWSILTDRTVKGARIIHLSYDISDSYPLSVLLSFVPKTSDYAQYLDLQSNVSANVKAADFSWPFIQRFSKGSSLDNCLISFNEILVGNTLSSGALVTVPTPQMNIFISAQTFYVEKPNYYVLGSVVTRVDQGVMRHSKEYAKRLDEAYQLLKSVSVDFD